MKVILRSDVESVGKKGDVVDVADGFARNYLVPKGLAMGASEGAIRQGAAMRRARDVRDAAARAEAEEVARKLVASAITISARAGAEGKLFGSVTTAEIADAVESQTGIALDRKALALAEPIKTVGSFTVTARLHSEVEFPLVIEVAAS